MFRATVLFIGGCAIVSGCTTNIPVKVPVDILQVTVADTVAFGPNDSREAKLLAAEYLGDGVRVRLLVPERADCIAAQVDAVEDSEFLRLNGRLDPSTGFDLDCNAFLGSSVITIALAALQLDPDSVEVTIHAHLPGRIPNSIPWRWQAVLSRHN